MPFYIYCDLQLTWGNFPCRTHNRYQDYLHLQSDFCLSPLYHSRNLLKRITKDEVRQGISVELVGPPGKRTGVLIRGTLVDLSDIGKMFYSLFNKIKQRWTVLLSGIDLEQHIKLPDTIVDKINNTSPGFYFGDIEANHLKEYENLLFKLILDNPQLGPQYLTTANNGDLAPNRAGYLKFLHEMESIQSVLGTLIFICSGSPYRRTKFATMCIWNLPGEKVRNARFVAGNIVFVSGYNKTSTRTLLYSPNLFYTHSYTHAHISLAFNHSLTPHSSTHLYSSYPYPSLSSSHPSSFTYLHSSLPSLTLPTFTLLHSTYLHLFTCLFSSSHLPSQLLNSQPLHPHSPSTSHTLLFTFTPFYPLPLLVHLQFPLPLLTHPHPSITPLLLPLQLLTYLSPCNHCWLIPTLPLTITPPYLPSPYPPSLSTTLCSFTHFHSLSPTHLLHFTLFFLT